MVGKKLKFSPGEVGIRHGTTDNHSFHPVDGTMLVDDVALAIASRVPARGTRLSPEHDGTQNCNIYRQHLGRK